MDSGDILKLVHAGEGVRIEFKGSLSDKNENKLAEEMAAFANTNGGTLLIGIDNDGGLRGVPETQKLIDQITTEARQKVRPALQPELGRVELDGKSIVWVRVPPSEDMYHFVNGRVYIRVAATIQPISDPQEFERLRRRLSRTSDSSVYDEMFLPPPVPFDFQGRKGEMTRLAQFLKSSRSLLAIEGISGIGKTALAVRFANSVAEQGYRAFWQMCHPLTTLESTLSNLAAFARSREDEPLASILEESGYYLEERMIRATAMLADRKYILFLDDFHFVADPTLIRFIGKVEERARFCKVVLAVRSRSSVLSASLRADEVHLSSGIDKEACGRFLSDWRVQVEGAETLDEVWHITGQGHPKALQILVARARTLPLKHLLSTLPTFGEDVTDKWLAPLLDELPSDEQEAVKDFCVFSRFLPLSAMCRSEPEKRYDLSFTALADRFIVDPGRADAPQVHPLIRGYCLPLVASIQDKHRWAANLYLQEAGAPEKYDMLSPQQKECLIAAWEHFIAADDNSEATRIVRTLRSTLTIRGELDQLMLLLERTPTTDDSKKWFDIDRARILDLWGSTEDAIPLLEPLSLSPDVRVAREAVLVLATVLLHQQQAQDAADLLSRHWEKFVRNVPPIVRTRFLSRFIEAQLLLGNAERAFECSSEVSQSCHKRGDKLGFARALRYMGSALHRQGRSDMALQLLTTSYELLLEEGRMREVALSKRLAAEVLATSDIISAEQLLHDSLTTFVAVGDRQNIQLCQNALRELTHSREKM